MAKVPDTPDNLKKCICGTCPSYNQCMTDKMHGMFCARGETDCELTKGGCLCGSCPLASSYKLDKMYYCAIGAAQ